MARSAPPQARGWSAYVAHRAVVDLVATGRAPATATTSWQSPAGPTHSLALLRSTSAIFTRRWYLRGARSNGRWEPASPVTHGGTPHTRRQWQRAPQREGCACPRGTREHGACGGRSALVVLAFLVRVTKIGALERRVPVRDAALVERNEDVSAVVAEVEGDLGRLNLLVRHFHLCQAVACAQCIAQGCYAGARGGGRAER